MGILTVIEVVIAKVKDGHLNSFWGSYCKDRSGGHLDSY